MTIFEILLAIVLGYLIGALPTAYLVARFGKGINIFEKGSGNMGGTNVARTLGLPWGVFTSFLDAMKGLAAAALARYLIPDAFYLAPMLAGIAAVAGHNWSVFATYLFYHYNQKFEIRGGKGAATAFGTMLFLIPLLPNVLLLVVGIGIAYFTRYASLAVLVSFALALVYTLVWALMQQGEYLIYIPYVLILAVLIAMRFRENIQRLLEGNERKLGDRVA